MRNLTRRQLAVAASAFACGALPGLRAAAQTYPSRPVTIVAPFAAGSGNDAVARLIAQHLAPVLGQPVLVENRVGAAGTVGTAHVARSAPDGHTLLVASISAAVTASTMKTPFDLVKDFAPVAMVGTQPYVLVAPNNLPAPTLGALLELAKARPGQFVYGTQGIGSLSHLQWEAVKTERAVDLLHVPYKGTPEALTDVLGGRVHLLMIPLSAGMGQIKAGAVRALGVSGERRSPSLPDVPTLLEQGFPVLSDSIWFSLLMPAGTPEAVQRRFNQAFATVLDTAEVKAAFGRIGMDPMPANSEAAAPYVRAQVAKWQKIVAASPPGKFSN